MYMKYNFQINIYLLTIKQKNPHFPLQLPEKWVNHYLFKASYTSQAYKALIFSQ